MQAKLIDLEAFYRYRITSNDETRGVYWYEHKNTFWQLELDKLVYLRSIGAATTELVSGHERSFLDFML